MPPDDGAAGSDTSAAITDEEVLKAIERYGPAVRFHKGECHFPGNPDSFRRISRFRESRRGKDRGWSRQANQWVEGDSRDWHFYDIDWDTVVAASRARLGHTGPDRIPDTHNHRPRDGKNPELSPSGLFLQRSPAAPLDRSGYPPQGGRLQKAPLTVDYFHNQEKGVVRVLFWFFYELNWFHLLFTHQGDWEHVTLFWDEDEFRAGQPPMGAYLAQHDHGEFLPFGDLERQDGVHPVFYVDRNGHPTHFRAKKPSDYLHVWRTWESKRVVFVETADWRDFAGGWGEVGEFKWSTGPLGPTQKLMADLVEVRMVDGKPYIQVSEAR